MSRTRKKTSRRDQPANRTGNLPIESTSENNESTPSIGHYRNEETSYNGTTKRRNAITNRRRVEHFVQDLPSRPRRRSLLQVDLFSIFYLYISFERNESGNFKPESGIRNPNIMNPDRNNSLQQCLVNKYEEKFFYYYLFSLLYFIDKLLKKSLTSSEQTTQLH